MGLKAVANLGGGGGTVTGSGTPGKLAKFTGAGTSIGDSLLSESGTTITSAATAETFTNAQTWTVGAPNSQALVVLSNAGPERTLVLDTIGRTVGVGTASGPATNLHVSDGVTVFAGTTGAGVRLDRATEALFSSSDGTRSLRAGLTGGAAVVGTSTAHDLLLQRGNVTAATLTSGAIATVTLTAGGAGYTNGTYSQQALTGGTGSGATADFVVAGGIITICVLRSPGTGYTAADALSCATLGAGAGLIITVATISQVVEGSGNVTALGRIGAGTATPRAALDAVGAILVQPASVVVAGTSRIDLGLGIIDSATLSANNGFVGVGFYPALNATGVSTGTQGFIASPSWSVTTAGQSPFSTGFQANFTRSGASDLATGASIFGFRTSLFITTPGATATASVLCFNASASFSTAIGHTVTTHSRYDSGSLNNAATITTFNGLNIAPVTGTGTVGTYYGVRLQANTVSAITNRWGISQEDTLAKNYFAGNVGVNTTTPAGKLDVNGTIRTAGYTVATLPAGTVGQRAYVTDALAPTYLGALVGGGAVTAPVFYNGAAWVSA
jgi:hypothetical protein